MGYLQPPPLPTGEGKQEGLGGAAVSPGSAESPPADLGYEPLAQACLAPGGPHQFILLAKPTDRGIYRP